VPVRDSVPGGAGEGSAHQFLQRSPEVEDPHSSDHIQAIHMHL
jgi:hypothetical protein